MTSEEVLLGLAITEAKRNGLMDVARQVLVTGIPVSARFAYGQATRTERGYAFGLSADDPVFRGREFAIYVDTRMAAMLLEGGE